MLQWEQGCIVRAEFSLKSNIVYVHTILAKSCGNENQFRFWDTFEEFMTLCASVSTNLWFSMKILTMFVLCRHLRLHYWIMIPETNTTMSLLCILEHTAAQVSY